MDKLAAAVTIILGLATLTALVAGTYVLFRAQLSKARITELQQDNSNVRSRLDDSDKELIKCQAREKALELTVEHQNEKIKMLEELVLQRAEVDEVKQEVVRLFAEFERLFDDLGAHHGATLAVLNQIKEAVSS